MDIVIDTSAIIAVIVGEPERKRIVELTTGYTLIGPGSIPWEMGNAFSAMLKQRRLTLIDALKGFAVFESIPIQFAKPDFAHAMTIAHRAKLYAYDAYFLGCAIRHNAPLVTLDRKLMMAAKTFKVNILEV